MTETESQNESPERMALDALRIETFEGRIGETFLAFTEDDQRPALKLIEATGTGGSTLNRAPFSLVFEAEEGLLAQQQMYTLEHAELGLLDVFLVPLTSTTSEAVFT